MSNLIAIVGRPNVGKSTLFNRLSKSRRAIVTDEAGTTRDRQYAKSEWNGQEFSIVDTGGWVVNSDDIFEEEIRRQVAIAIEEADIILFVVDVQNGITDLDLQVAQILRQSKKTVLLVSNKCDTFDLQYQSSEFYAFGLGDPYSISAVNGAGTGELLDQLVVLMKENKLTNGRKLPWKQFSHKSYAVFSSVKKEFTIGVLAVTTLTFTCAASSIAAQRARLWACILAAARSLLTICASP